MTIGQLIESITAKKVCSTHTEVWNKKRKRDFDPEYENFERASDGTPFMEMNIEERMAELKRLGYESTGTEVLIDGITGEMIEDAFIFQGPVYYQRLKHLVSNKVHARATGPNESLVRQPTAGRTREGGLKIGCVSSSLLTYLKSWWKQKSSLKKRNYYINKPCGNKFLCNLLGCGPSITRLPKREK